MTVRRFAHGRTSSPSPATLALDFIGRGDILDSRVTFSRTTTATRFNSAGILESVAIDGPRFDYNPVTLAARGLLIEEQRTNLALYSNDLTDAAWVAANTATAKTATGPDGVANSATTLTATAANATVLQTITSASAARATSCYIKRRTGTGVVEMTQNNGTTWTAVTVTAAWTRVTIASATVANPVIGLRIVTDTDAVDVYGFQCEIGAFPTSIIPTTAAAVTRTADVATMTGTNFSDWYNQSEGAFFAEGGPVANTGSMFATNDGTFNNFIAHFFQFGVNSRTWVTQVNVTQALLSTPASGTVKHALSYATNDVRHSVNGGSVIADTSAVIPSVDRMSIGQRLTANNINGHIRLIAFYPRKLSSAELQALTA
jgi:hypothetical protein